MMTRTAYTFLTCSSWLKRKPVITIMFIAHMFFVSAAGYHPSISEQFVCFNTILEISCRKDEIIVFESARYGRNDSVGASRCVVTYTRSCDVDVHFSLNRACAGRQQCSMAVNTALFGDPCGYEEFLKVAYRCVEVPKVQIGCPGSRHQEVQLYDRGYIASPKYPGKYDMDAECRWKVKVLRNRTLRITLFDFELDVKRNGRCHEYLEISSSGTTLSSATTDELQLYLGSNGGGGTSQERIYFRDCGSLGKQIFTLDANEVIVTFKTGMASLAQRGFLLHFEATGPRCPDLQSPPHGHITYYISDDTVYANQSCDKGYVLVQTDITTKSLSSFAIATSSSVDRGSNQLRCVNSHWNNAGFSCAAFTSLLAIKPETVTTKLKPALVDNKAENVKATASLIGLSLSIMAAVLLITLMFATALYIHRRRYKADTDRDHVINNLQFETNSSNGGGVKDRAQSVTKCSLNGRLHMSKLLRNLDGPSSTTEDARTAIMSRLTTSAYASPPQQNDWMSAAGASVMCIPTRPAPLQASSYRILSPGLNTYSPPLAVKSYASMSNDNSNSVAVNARSNAVVDGSGSADVSSTTDGCHTMNVYRRRPAQLYNDGRLGTSATLGRNVRIAVGRGGVWRAVDGCEDLSTSSSCACDAERQLRSCEELSAIGAGDEEQAHETEYCCYCCSAIDTTDGTSINYTTPLMACGIDGANVATDLTRSVPHLEQLVNNHGNNTVLSNKHQHHQEELPKPEDLEPNTSSSLQHDERLYRQRKHLSRDQLQERQQFVVGNEHAWLSNDGCGQHHVGSGKRMTENKFPEQDNQSSPLIRNFTSDTSSVLSD